LVSVFFSTFVPSGKIVTPELSGVPVSVPGAAVPVSGVAVPMSGVVAPELMLPLAVPDELLPEPDELLPEPDELLPEPDELPGVVVPGFSGVTGVVVPGSSGVAGVVVPGSSGVVVPGTLVLVATRSVGIKPAPAYTDNPKEPTANAVASTNNVPFLRDKLNFITFSSLPYFHF